MSGSEALYRKLLALTLPESFLGEAEEELAEVFRDLRRRSLRGGLWPRLTFWPRIVLDLAWTGVVEWWSEWRTDDDDGRTTMSGRSGFFRSGLLGQWVRGPFRRPGHALVVAVTVGLAVGAGTVVAVLGRDVLLRSLPYDDPGELLRLREADDEGHVYWPSRANFEDWRRLAAPPILGIEAATAPEPSPLLLDGRAVRARVAQASAGLFDLLGVSFARGRAPTLDKARPGGPGPTAVVSRAFWETHLQDRAPGGDALLIGTERFPVVGVLERDVGFLADGGAWGQPDVWIPLEREPNRQHRGSHGIHVVARTAPGVTLARADEALDGIAGRVAETTGQGDHVHSILTTSLEEDLVGGARRPLEMLFLAALGVLLVAGLNLAGTLLVDGIGRERELAVRKALGAGRGKLVAQLLTEAAAAALPGALLGLGLAWSGLELARRLDPGALPRLAQVGIDPAIFGLAAGGAVALAMSAAALPGLLLSGARAVGRVATRGGSGPGRKLRRIWNGTIAAQVAVTLILLVGSTLLLRDLRSTLNADLGFEPSGVVSAHLSLPPSRYGEPVRRIQLIEEALSRARALPGVESATVADLLPHVTQARISGTSNPDSESEDWLWVGFRAVDASYFRVMGIPVLRADEPPFRSQGQVMVDRTVQERLYPDGVTGRRVRNGIAGEARPIAGVVGSVREWGVSPGTIGMIYADFRTVPSRMLEPYLLVRGRDGRTPPVAEIRSTLAHLDPQVPVTVEPLVAVMARTLGTRRLVLAVTSAFGLLGLVLASLGVYGIVAYVVRRGAREAGIRIALGAHPGQVRRRALLGGLWPAAAGLFMGSLGAVALAGILGSRIQDLEVADPASFVVATLLVGLAAAVASWIPARRASRVDPVEVLREE